MKSLLTIARMSDADARSVFEAARWPDGTVCPDCGHDGVYAYSCRPIFKCQGCGDQFSPTSGTVFASRKLSFRDCLFLAAAFVAGAKGISALQMAKYAGVEPKTAYQMQMKFRRAIAAEQDGLRLAGEVEVDGAFFGGYKRAANQQRTPGGKKFYYRAGNRKVVVVARERGGRTLTSVCNRESGALFWLRRVIQPGAVIHADGSNAFDSLADLYRLMRIEHKFAFSKDGACTNWAESYFSRLRRVQMGTYHRIGGPHTQLFAAEAAWREDHRRLNVQARTELLLDLTMRTGPAARAKNLRYLLREEPPLGAIVMSENEIAQKYAQGGFA